MVNRGEEKVRVQGKEAKRKSFDLGGNRTHDLRIRSTVTLPTELRGRTEKVGDDFRWRRESNGTYGSLIPFTRANAQWVIHGFKKHFNLHFRVNSLFHYLCSSATRHNIHMNS